MLHWLTQVPDLHLWASMWRRSRPELRVLLASLVAVFGCTSATSPHALPTLLVTNATCSAGRCATLEIRAFVWKFTVPQLPDGLEILGDAPPGTTCLTFPAKWTLRAIGQDTVGGPVDTTTFTWTPADTVPIYLIGVDSAAYHSGLDSALNDSIGSGLIPYFDRFWVASVGETANFTPGTASGWDLTLPSVPIRNAPLVQANACSS
jgi:hypothetical protein